MEILLIRYSTIIRRIRQKQGILRIEEFKQTFDNFVSYLNKLTSDKRKTDGMHILTTICDELAYLNTFRLFDNLILRNHPIFNYIKQTFEMLLIKSIHSQTISMTKQEEDCFNATSYFIAQLCLYQNELVELFYGKVSTEIYEVTEKPNTRDQEIDENSKRPTELMEKPNLKTARLRPNAPEARPIEQREPDIREILGRKKFPYKFVPLLNETEAEYPIPQSNQIREPPKKYQDIFLTKSFFDTLVRAIDDLSRNDYSPYHVKYKVVDRLVRLCSQLNIVDELLSPIMKCLRSRYYRDAIETTEVNQIRLNPRQLSFIHECPQLIVQHNFLQQEKLAGLLCRTIIEATKPIFDRHFLATDTEIGSNVDGDRWLVMHVLSCQIEFLYHFSMTSSGRQHFLQSSTVTQLLLMLRQSTLINTAQQNKFLFNTDVGIVAHSLMLLSNLAYEKPIFLMLKQTDLKDICLQLQSAKDSTIQFASQMLITILNQEAIDENHEPAKLKEMYTKFLDSAIVEAKQETRLGLLRHREGKEVKIKYRFVSESFLERLIRDMKGLFTKEYLPNAQKYKDVVRRIHVCTKQETDEVESLLNPIAECLTSDKYVSVYQKIDLSQAKVISGVSQTSCNFAAKQIFFICECPEFLIRHDYKRQKEIATLLCKKMLEKTGSIFTWHLHLLVGNKDDDDTEEMKNARIEALRLHIKLLNHIALTPSTRKHFLATSIIDQILLILQDKTLVDRNGRIVDTRIGIVGQSLTLLYNLALDKQMLSIMNTKNLLQICLKFRLETDKLIQFTSQTLTIMLDSHMIDSLAEPLALFKTYIDYIDKSVKEPRQPYHGVKLRGLLKNLQIIILNDLVQENIIEEEYGIISITKCVSVSCKDKPKLPSLEKIRRLALNIIWDLLRSICGPTASMYLKSNDLFVDYVLTLVNETSKKRKKLAKDIIWKLGDQKTFLSEHAEKEKENEEDKQEEDEMTATDDQFTTNNQWDDSIPFDLMISYSNSANDKNICHRICKRLIAKNVRVYIEKQGKHRLEVMQKAVTKGKIIVVCLSSEYRKSKVCMAEVEYAYKHKSPIIAVLVDAKYKVKGWLNHLVGEKAVIDFTQKNFDDGILKLMNEIENIKGSDQ